MNTNSLTVVAILKAKPGKESILRQELLSLIAPSRKDPGCINYDLHQVVDSPGAFLFHENWTSKKLLDEHLAQPHTRAFFAKAGELLAEPPQLVLCEKIG